MADFWPTFLQFWNIGRTWRPHAPISTSLVVWFVSCDLFYTMYRLTIQLCVYTIKLKLKVKQGRKKYPNSVGANEFRGTLINKKEQLGDCSFLYRGVGSEEKWFLFRKIFQPNLKLVLRCINIAVICNKISYTQPIALWCQPLCK